MAPSTPFDAKGLLKSAIRDNDPVVFLEHKKTYRLVKGNIPKEEYTIPIGKADVKIEGQDVTLVTYGLMLHHCVEAARILKEENVAVEVIDLRTLRPIDQDTVIRSVVKTGRALIVHEDTLALGIGAEISAILSEHVFDSLDAPIKRLAGPEVPAMPFSPTLESQFMINTEQIVKALKELTEY